MKQTIKNCQGMTLLEIIVALGIFIMVTGTVMFFVNQGFQVQNFSLEQTIAIQEAQRGVSTMVREIREIQIADDGAYPIVLAQDSEFIFFSDMDKDDAVERVRYFLDGSIFKKGVIEPRTNPTQYVLGDEVINILSQYVRNSTTPIFIYYNRDWPSDEVNNPLAAPASVADIRFININLRVNVRESVAPSDFLLKTDVQIRNLKDNL